MIRLIQASNENKALLWRMLQEYLHEMARYYDIDRDENGNYAYRYFDAYFSEPERKALLIYAGGELAGFAMINPHSYIGAKPEHVLAEFMILPTCRGRGIASEAAEHILQSYPGSWEIKYSENNAAARGLWNKITARHGPARHACGEDETVLAFSTMK